jgi:hypothetical protein
MKKAGISLAAACAAAVLSCAPKAVQLDFSDVPDNERCRYMKEICKEAEAFHNRYQSMSKEEKEDAKAILNAYVQQCEGAQELCKKSR